MTNITPDDPFLQNLNIQKVVNYLESMGWKKVDHPNTRINLFEGPQDDEGEPIELVLPGKMSYEDASVRLTEAINTLAALQGRTPRSIINEITFSRPNQIFAVAS